MKNPQFRPLSILLIVSVILTLTIQYRLSRIPQWFPDVPQKIGDFTSSDVPLDGPMLSLLGNPHAGGYRYANTFDDKIECHVIAAETYAAYHDPQICMAGYGYSKTAAQTMYPFGANYPVRALVLKRDSDGQRVLMYYWVQYRDGTTGSTDEVNLHTNVITRFVVGLNKAFDSQPSCIVRAYSFIYPSDHFGLQARRNIEQISRGIHDAVMAQKASGR